MHVDGAYGGPAVIADALRPLFDGIEHADSIAFDPHKWMYTPHSGGCVLVRDERLLQAAFDAEASYVHEDTDRVEHDIDFARLGPQFSRGFQALKIWVSLLAHGRRAYSERIAHDAALARYLAARVRSHPSFELSAPVTLSICCFRYVPEDLPTNGPEAAASENYLSQRASTLNSGPPRSASPAEPSGRRRPGGQRADLLEHRLDGRAVPTGRSR